MNKILKVLIIIIVFIAILVTYNIAKAADQYKCSGGTVIYSSLSDCTSSGCTNCITVTPGTSGGTVQLTNPLGEKVGTSIPKLLGVIINAVLGIVGSLALVMFIYGGVTWMLAAGNAERVTKGKNILIWATIGLVVIFAAYALVKFVFTSIGAPS